MRRVQVILVVMGALAAGIHPALAGQAGPPPEIAVSGRAEARLPADRASIHLAVATKAGSAVAAVTENASVQQAVIEALQRLGIDSKRITTAGYSVAQDWRYDPGRQPRPEGYVARNTIRVEVAQLERIGALVDAAVAAGANRIDSIEFTASGLAEARRSLLATAIVNARADAEAMAKAAGGSLGPLIDLSTEPPQQAIPLRAGVMSATQAAGPAGAETRITPREILVEAVVYARWQFTPSRQSSQD